MAFASAAATPGDALAAVRTGGGSFALLRVSRYARALGRSKRRPSAAPLISICGRGGAAHFAWPLKFPDAFRSVPRRDAATTAAARAVARASRRREPSPVNKVSG